MAELWHRCSISAMAGQDRKIPTAAREVACRASRLAHLGRRKMGRRTSLVLYLLVIERKKSLLIRRFLPCWATSYPKTYRSSFDLAKPQYDFSTFKLSHARDKLPQQSCRNETDWEPYYIYGYDCAVELLHTLRYSVPAYITASKALKQPEKEWQCIR